MSSISPQVFIKLSAFKGIHPDILKAFPKGKVSVSADVNGEKKETRRISIGGTQKANENLWNGNSGVVKWDLKSDDMKALKARQPMLRLDITAHTEDESRSQSRGFVMVDIRDLERGIINQWVKVSSLPGTEVLLTAKLNTTILSGNATDDSPPISSPSTPADYCNPSNRAISVAASTESALSTLCISDDEHLSNDDIKFALSIAFTNFSHVTEYCKRFIDYDAIAHEEVEVKPFWLSWTVLDQTFQSDEFTVVGVGPQRCRDTVRTRCSSASMLKAIYAASPLKVYLCTENTALAMAEIPLNYSSTVASVMDQPGSKLHLFPLQFQGSYSFTALQEEFFEEGNVAAVEILVEAKVEEIIRNESDVQQRGAMDAATATGTSDADDDTDGYDDTFEEDPSETEEPAVPTDKKSAGGRNRGVRFNEGDDMDEEGANHGRASQRGTGGGGGGGGGGLRRSGGRKGNRDRKGRRRSDDEDTDGDEEEDAEEEDSDADEYSRHFRISVDVRSIGGLKRAANASVQFTYPFFGTGGPVRTHPIWLPANAEGKIDGGAATYDCCMSRGKLRQVLMKHPFKIAVLSRTNLGTEQLAQVVVDLLDIYRSEPHSLRCPLTGRVFKTMEDYKHHRDIMLALRASGTFDVVPPKDPVSVWSRDLIIPLAADVGGRVRVAAFIEDLALVGSEKSVPVKPGYKMHNGALYPADANDSPEQGNQSGNSGAMSATGPNQGSGGGGIGQFSSMSELQADWEKWRAAAEAQWREALREKEQQMRAKVEADAANTLAARADDLRRAQEEAGRLEVRLRTAIDAAERQKSQLNAKEEQLQMKLAQKTAELQLLQRRVRDEAKARVDAETRRADGLATQVSVQKDTIDRLQGRIREVEREFENFRAYARSTPETVLREEVARLKAQLGECRAEVERERRIRSEAELEKEHYRAQMHRLALALKRERERNSAAARQELEQLRLEFLAREERYVLDGDREELRTIRQELASLRSFTQGGGGGGSRFPSNATSTAATAHTTGTSTYTDAPTIPSSSAFAGAGGRGQRFPVTQGGDRSVPSDHGHGASPLPLPLPTPPPQAAAVRPHREPVYVDDEHERSFTSTSSRAGDPESKVAYLQSQLEDLLATGFYDDPNDPVVVTLRNELAQAERLAAGGGGGAAAAVATAASTSFASVSASVTSMEDALDAFYD